MGKIKLVSTIVGVVVTAGSAVLTFLADKKKGEDIQALVEANKELIELLKK